jgi:hypothetical protein
MQAQGMTYQVHLAGRSRVKSSVSQSFTHAPFN